MKKMLTFLKHCLIAISFCILIASCSKYTQANYEKIKPNMTMKEVIAILGEPTSSESLSIAGISGTSAVWQDGYSEIDIQFLNDKVVVKNFGKPGEAGPSDIPPAKLN